jgi:hypothetical protein
VRGVPRAVFLDSTGRRRRVATVAGAGLAVAALAALGLLIGGVSGVSPLRLPGLPAQVGAPAGGASDAGRAPASRTQPTPGPGGPVPSPAPSAGAVSPTPLNHGRRPSQTPTHPGQSKRK